MAGEAAGGGHHQTGPPFSLATTPYSHPDTTVPKANTQWYYRVSAINSVGTSEPSDATSAATFPGVPTVPRDLTAWEEGPTRIVLQWQEPAVTGGEITGYRIEYSETANFASTPLVLVANTMSMATTYTDNGLKAGDIRFYRVYAINSRGPSPVSTSYSAVTGTTALQPPTSLTAVSVGQKSIALVWTPPPSADPNTVYMVERSENGSTGWARVVPPGIGTVTGTTYTDNDPALDMDLELSTKYYYRVSTTATSPDIRRSRPSNVANATTGGVEPPEAPMLV